MNDIKFVFIGSYASSHNNIKMIYTPFYDYVGEIGIFNVFPWISLWNHKLCVAVFKMFSRLFLAPNRHYEDICILSDIFEAKTKMTKIYDQSKLEKKWKILWIFPKNLLFRKILKFWCFGGFRKFQLQFFLSFLVFHQKQFFLPDQSFFCFLKKFFRSISQIQSKCWTLFGGGGGAIISPSTPKNPNCRFRQHCRKMRLWNIFSSSPRHFRIIEQ